MKKIYTIKISSRHQDMLLVDVLADKTKFSKSKIKELLNGGSVWKRDPNPNKKNKMNRIRRAQTKVLPNDHYNLYYDSEIRDIDLNGIKNIHQTRLWSIWYKPQSVLSQGTKYGDHGSILRFVEKKYPETYLVHRLDRETSGLMLFAHTKKLAHELSLMFQKNQIKKTYQAQVLGVLKEISGTINIPLEGKEATTHWKKFSSDGVTTLVEVILETGRQHQIRKHFSMLGHPVMGDPKYGEGNKNQDGMKLVSVSLTFKRECEDKMYSFTLPKELCLF